MKLHVFSDSDVEYYIAQTLQDARKFQRDLIGENPTDADDWYSCPDDADLLIWLDDDFEGVSEHGEGILVVGQMRVWAESFPEGFLCSMEW